MFFDCCSANNRELIDEQCFVTPNFINKQGLHVGDFDIITYKCEKFPGEVKVVEPDGLVTLNGMKDTTRGYIWTWPARDDVVEHNNVVET